MPPGFPMPKLLGDLPRPPFHGIPNSFLPQLPTSLAMSNPSLNHPEHFPFSPFGFPGPLNRPRDLSPSREAHRPRSASPPRDHRPPPPLLHPAILAAQSPDFPHIRPHHNDLENRPASETSSDDFKFEKMEFGNSQFSLGNMSGKFVNEYILVLYWRNHPLLMLFISITFSLRFHFKACWSHFTISWFSFYFLAWPAELGRTNCPRTPQA